MGLSDVTKILEPDVQRKLAAGLFNHTWDLLDKKDRTREESDRMIHAAHASRFAWEDIGTSQNRAVGEWQVSRVYATLGRPEPAMFHAKRCVEIIEAAGIEGFYRASGYEGMARAYSVAGNVAECAKYIDFAKEEAKKILDEEEKAILLGQLEEIPEYEP